MTNYSFNDLHIHSTFSDEDFCNVTPEIILEKAQAKAIKLGKPCVISITDHNSILGSVDAQRLIKTRKYDQVKFINGVEITTDLCELNQMLGRNIFKRAHILMYNFDETNPELLAYSKITHLKLTDSLENVGLQFCAARRAINERYHINIPFTELLPLTHVKPSQNLRTKFISVVMPYLEKLGIVELESDIEQLISPYLNAYVDYNKSCETYSRLKLREVAEMAKNAGGELVLAHPSLTKLSLRSFNKYLQSNNLEIEDIKNSDNDFSLGQLTHKDTFLNLLFNTANEMGIKISGIEKYSATSILGRTDVAMQRVAKKFGLYVTSGSDYHGDTLTANVTVGDVFLQEVHNGAKELLGKSPNNEEFIYVTHLPCVDYFLGDKYANLDQDGTVLSLSGDEIISKDMLTINKKALPLYYKNKEQQKKERKRQQKENEKQTEKIQCKENKKDVTLQVKIRIKDLIKILQGSAEVIKNKYEKTEAKVQKLLSLNKFAQSVYESMVHLVECGKIDPIYLEQIKDALEKINKNLCKISQKQPKVAKSYKIAVSHNKKQKEDYLNKLINIDLGR